MSEWKEYELGEITVIIDCEHKTAPLVEDSDFISVRTSDISRGEINYGNCNRVSKEVYTIWTKRMVPKEDDIILAREAPVGEVGLIKKNWNVCLGQRTVLLRANEKFIDAKYLLYYLIKTEVKYDLISRSTGSVVEHLNVKDIKNFSVKIFSSKEIQRTISSILSSLDDKIDLLQRQNKTLEQLAEALFRQWFVEEAEVSWEVGTLSDEFDFVMGQSPEGVTLNEDRNGIIFYQGRSDFGYRFPEPRVYTTAPSRIAKKFDTLVSVRAPVGDMNMAFEECCLGRGVAAFRYKSNPAFYSYSYYKLRSLMQQIKQFEDNGSVFGSIGKDDFKKLENVIPSKEKISEFQSVVKPIDVKIYLNTIQIKQLTQLRDALLPKLMSGEVRVNNKKN